MLLMISGFLIATLSPEEAYDAKGDDIIPSLFQGKWAPAIKDCTDEDQVSNLNISATRVEAYDFRVKLLKHAGLHFDQTNSGKDAQTLTMLAAESGEGEVSFGRVRLALSGGKLYFDRPDEKTRTLDTSKGGYVRCPSRNR